MDTPYRFAAVLLPVLLLISPVSGGEAKTLSTGKPTQKGYAGFESKISPTLSEYLTVMG